MSRFPLTLLATSISAAVYFPQAIAADDLSSSVQELPTKDQCLVSDQEVEDVNQLPINVEADSLEAINGEKAVYQGNVVVTQGNRKMTADNVTLHQDDNIVVATGNVSFNDGQFTSTSDKATNNLVTNEISLENTQYQMLCEQGRGEAIYITKDGRGVYEMSDGTITSCPEGDNSWRMKASSIEVNQEEERATLYDPRFEVLDVPIFYMPYMTLPLSDARKTGVLYPSVSYGSSDGFEFEIPVYWNLAPNYDLTSTFRYMEKRGLQLDGEFRYLSTYGLSTLDGEYLANDKKYDDQDRWAFQFQHSGIINTHWKVNVDYSKVSDVDYFQEVDSRIGNREDGQLVQEGSVSYRSANWDTTLLVRDFQVLTDTETENQPYRLMPQLKANYYAPEIYRNLDFDIISHISVFDTDSTSMPTATRVHIEPGITLPFGNSWGSWTTEARLLATHYEQNLDNLDSSTNLEESVTRVLPELRTHAGMVLERDTELYTGYTQTLEPQIQYVYVPYEDQNNISTYDSTLLQTDYYGLFRTRQYSGVDRIESANQLSYGASTRFYDDEYRERLAISFGQILFIDRKNTVKDDDNNANYSAWAVEADFNYNDHTFYHGGIQYDIETNSIQHANTTIEYRHNAGYVQGNYRYVSKEYIQETLDSSLDSTTDIDEITKNGISQVGFLTGYQINRNWNAQLHYFYDLTIKEDLEWLANLNYTSDCWYVGLTYSNQLRNWSATGASFYDSDPVYENNLSINFGIVGFGTTVRTDEYDISGSKNSLSYGRPFILND
ncbi:LPS assembly protein LptD [Vibrio sp. FNV 38]|nr:LPS assembly protein LptD [Vibrio sp. FNV 38]